MHRYLAELMMQIFSLGWIPATVQPRMQLKGRKILPALLYVNRAHFFFEVADF